MLLPNNAPVPLAAVLCTEELNRRPSREADYGRENRALTALARALAESPRTILQQVANTVLEVLECDSAGVSVLSPQDGGKTFRWAAIAGQWRPDIGGGMPRDFGPCGDVLDRNAPLLFNHFERRYTYFQAVTPPVEECLLVPFYLRGRVVGTIWAIAHNELRKFDGEDRRQLVSLSAFTAAAYQAVEVLEAVEEREHAYGRLAAIVEWSDDAIASKDLNGIITTWNAAAERLFGYAAQEIVGQPVTLLMPPERVDEEAGILECIRRGVTVDHYETVRRRKDGTLFDASVTVSPIRNAQGQVIGASKIARNISAVKEAEGARAKLLVMLREANERLVLNSVHSQTMTEAAERANSQKDAFLATLSHELRTPLGAILGWAQAMQMTPYSPERAGPAIASIERNALVLRHLINDLLDVARIDSGTLHMVHEPVDLVGVTQTALDAVRPQAAAKNIELQFSPPSTEPFLGDGGRLTQVMWNLIANAIKFTPAGGRVDVFIVPSSTHVEIRVVDTGAGISPDLLPHVFDRFRQHKGATTQRHSGLGLGLAIVRQIVELHGGTVHAASAGVGHGATFSVRLPISTSDRPNR